MIEKERKVKFHLTISQSSLMNILHYISKVLQVS